MEAIRCKRLHKNPPSKRVKLDPSAAPHSYLEEEEYAHQLCQKYPITYDDFRALEKIKHICRGRSLDSLPLQFHDNIMLELASKRLFHCMMFLVYKGFEAPPEAQRVMNEIITTCQLEKLSIH